MAEPRIAVLPYGKKLGLRPGRFPLDALYWPGGQPDETHGKCLRDLGPADHLIIFPSSSMHWRPGFGTRAQVSVMFQEPEALHGHHMQKLRRSHRRFYRVLTGNVALLRVIPNGLKFVGTPAWVPEWQDLDLTKTRHMSLIASAKRSLEGHALRHEIADFTRANGLDVDVMGGGYDPFDTKSDGLAPYRFSVVIENVREENYFTEKLVDALLCRTVPIYWGCPNVGDFFDTEAMIICESRAEIEAAITAARDETYDHFLPALERAQGQAAAYINAMDRAASAIRATLI